MSLLPKSHVDDLRVYEPGRPLEDVARDLGFSDISELVKVASNENPLGPSPKAVEAMQEALGDLHLYPDGGAFYLTQALCESLDVQPENVILGNGSNELIELLGHVFLSAGTNIVMSESAFLVYALVAASFEADVIQVPMADGYVHDLDAMAAAITPETRLVFIANPNNPTGTIVDPAALEQFIDQVPDHVLVVLDEAYIELMPQDLAPDGIDWVRADRNLILLRTFSKAYGLAGLRIGYGLASPEIIQWLNKFRQPFNTNRMAQVGALAALDDQAFLSETRRTVLQGLMQWAEVCEAEGWGYVPSYANFILIEVGDSRRAFNDLQPMGIIARPMEAYGLAKYLRFSIGTTEENQRAIDALREWRSGHGA
jgi:histidinol-phosphate aminotransferase